MNNFVRIWLEKYWNIKLNVTFVYLYKIEIFHLVTTREKNSQILNTFWNTIFKHISISLIIFLKIWLRISIELRLI